MKIKVLITGLVLVFSVIFLLSGKTISLTGKIQDYSGKGIVFGTLKIYTNDAEQKLIYETETDLNGSFALNDVIPGVYKMVIDVPGFEGKTKTLRLSNKKNNLGTIKLEGNVIMLDTAVIYGKSSESI